MTTFLKVTGGPAGSCRIADTSVDLDLPFGQIRGIQAAEGGVPPAGEARHQPTKVFIVSSDPNTRIVDLANTVGSYQ